MFFEEKKIDPFSCLLCLSEVGVWTFYDSKIFKNTSKKSSKIIKKSSKNPNIQKSQKSLLVGPVGLLMVSEGILSEFWGDWSRTFLFLTGFGLKISDFQWFSTISDYWGPFWSNDTKSFEIVENHWKSPIFNPKPVKNEKFRIQSPQNSRRMPSGIVRIPQEHIGSDFMDFWFFRSWPEKKSWPVRPPPV